MHEFNVFTCSYEYNILYACMYLQNVDFIVYNINFTKNVPGELIFDTGIQKHVHACQLLFGFSHNHVQVCTISLSFLHSQLTVNRTAHATLK